MEMIFAGVARALSYAFSAPVSMWLGFLFLNDRNRHVAYFFFGNALMNLGWLASLALVTNGFSDREWRSFVTPLIVLNALLLTGALVSRLRRRMRRDIYYPC